MPKHEKVDYFEFHTRDIAATKRFFSTVFGWEYVDYSDQYVAIQNAGLDGGFYQSDNPSVTSEGGVLIVFFSDDLDSTQDKIIAAGGEIVKPVFSFPGGRRFHFADPVGNEFAVWSAG